MLDLITISSVATNPENRPGMQASGRNGRTRGFSLLMIAVTATVMFGILGLAFDLGCVFIVKNELQAFVDASALASCR